MANVTLILFILLMIGTGAAAASDMSVDPVTREFFAAVESGSRKACALVDAIDGTARDGDGRTPLLAAVRAGNHRLVRLLLERSRPDQAVVDNDGNTALHLAVKSLSYRIVGTLLAAGLSPNVFNAAGETPLHLAAEAGGGVMSALLLDAGGDPAAMDAKGRTVLMAAAASGNRELLQTLVVSGGAATATATDREGRPLIHFASGDAAQLLIQQGEVDLRGEYLTENGSHLVTPLVEQVFRENWGAVGSMLRYGADINQATSDYGLTPLLAAALAGSWDLAVYLLDHGARPDVSLHGIAEEPERGLLGSHPLLMAVLAGEDELACRMATRFPDYARRRNAYGLLPLQVATARRDERIAQCLRLAGATLTPAEEAQALLLRARESRAHAAAFVTHLRQRLAMYREEHRSYPATREAALGALVAPSEVSTLAYEPGDCSGDGCHGYRLQAATEEGGGEFLVDAGRTFWREAGGAWEEVPQQVEE